jgi:small basic protein
MPKKEDDGGLLHKLKDMLVERFSTTVVENVSLHIKELMHRLQELVYLTQKKIIEQFYVSGFFFAGYVMVALSVLFYLIDTLGWSRSRATLTAGVLLLATSAAMKQYVMKTRSER